MKNSESVLRRMYTGKKLVLPLGKLAPALLSRKLCLKK